MDARHIASTIAVLGGARAEDVHIGSQMSWQEVVPQLHSQFIGQNEFDGPAWLQEGWEMGGGCDNISVWQYMFLTWVDITPPAPPFYRRRNYGSEKLFDLPNVTRFLSSKICLLSSKQ